MSSEKCFCHIRKKKTGECYAVKDATARKQLEDKVDKVEGKGLSTNDYTTEEKTKLAGLSNYNDSSLKKRVSALESKDISQDTSISNNATAIEALQTRATNIENNKADKTELFSGSYNDLTDKPVIPSIEGLATEEFVTNAVPTNNDQLTNGAGYLTRNDLVDLIFPIGSIYMSIEDVSPGNVFIGTYWERLRDRFLIGAGSSYSVNATGGEATHELTVEEMPSHSHEVWYNSYSFRGGDYSRRVTYDSPSGPTGSISTQPSGGNTAHNNMPPYLAVYMWKRVPYPGG